MPLSHMLPLSILPPRRPTSATVLPRRPVDLRKIEDGFGLPSAVDPDPFGVLALERAGLAIKEAGSRQRATSEAFEYRPAPTSPVFRLSLQSSDGAQRQSSRESRWSMKSVDQSTQTANLPEAVEEEEDAGETASPSAGRESYIAAPAPAYHSPIREHHEQEAHRRSVLGGDFVDSPVKEESSEDSAELSPQSSHYTTLDTGVTVAVVAEAFHSPVVAKPRLVSIQRRPAAPAVPSRNPLRAVRVQAAQAAEEADDVSPIDNDDSSSAYSVSPTRSGFDGNSPQPWSEQTSVMDTESLHLKSSRQASLDLPDSDASPSRHGSQDMGSPLSREVGNERPQPSPQASAELADPERYQASKIAFEHNAKIDCLTRDAETWRDEDEFHSIPSSPALTPLPAH